MTTTREEELPQQNALYILGILQLFDRDGVDIAAKLGPTLRLLLQIILIETVEERGSVSSEMIDTIVWPNVEKRESRNSRGVNMNKLRRLLSSVDGIEIIHKSSLWHVQISPPLFCDYKRVKEIISAREFNSLLSLTELVKRGNILSTIEDEWADSSKERYTRSVIQFLEPLADKKELFNSEQSALNMSMALLKIDELNEVALSIYCTTLIGMGRASLALDGYRIFCNNYQQLYNEPYPIEFNSFTL